MEAFDALHTAAGTLPPELVDHPDFEIIRELGRGAMGVVYLVHNRLMGRDEAIKVIGRQLMERPVVLDRFLREIRSVARLRHPNVVAAYSATRMGESIVYAMEYVEGLDLARLVKRKGPLPVAHASYFIHQVALGLQHAHEHGIVHRDIKPGNLILTRSGDRSTVKILDFGLNKVTCDKEVDHSLTREGQMLGTPDYIAPEQTLDAQSVDIRADIYSLGCTLYYLLSGRPPFRAGTLFEVLQAHHSTEATALDLVRPEVPIELAGVVARMMAKQPRQRFQTPAEVASALVPFFKKGSVVAIETKTDRSPAIPNGPIAPLDQSLSTQPAPELDCAACLSRQGSGGGTRPESGWESLIELKETGPLIGDASAAPKLRRSALAIWLAAAAAVAALMLIVSSSVRSFYSRSPVAVGTDRISKVEPPGRNESATDNVSAGTELPGEIAPTKSISTSTASPELIALGTKRPSPSRVIDRPRDRIATTDVTRDHQPAPRLDRSLNPGATQRKQTPGPVDFRQLVAVANLQRLPDPNAVRPTEGFWPSLAPENLENWQIADPDHIKISADGVSLAAGPHGNFLLTRDESFRKCTLSIILSVKEGTDAFLALRARRGPQVWRAITSRVNEESGKILAGHQSIDFHVLEEGSGRKQFAPDKSCVMKIHLDDKNVARVTVKADRTSSVKHDGPPRVEDAGAVGVFVKSGTVVIKHLDVQED